MSVPKNDLHKATATEVFGVPLSDVSRDQRRAAKAINFGLMYGITTSVLTHQIAVNKENPNG